MTQIEFDPSGSLDIDFGVSSDQVERCIESISGSIRDSTLWHQNDTDSAYRFFSLPQQHADQYASVREKSELGRVFQNANRLHDEIDAVVVLGHDEWTLTAQVLMKACCDPFHNELDRARRGSKPRVYFVGNHFDNDSVASLLHRLRVTQFDQTVAQTRWALIVIDDLDTGADKASSPQAGLRELLLAELQKANGEQWPERLFWISRHPDHSKQKPDWQSPPIEETIEGSSFLLPPGVPPQAGLLTAATLLPAAMLGLDCMKLTEGALVMNQHFLETPDAKNLPLRWWAVHHQLATHQQRTNSKMKVWPTGLDRFPLWYHCLTEMNQVAADEPLAMTCPSVVIDQVVVQNDRHDRFPPGLFTEQSQQAMPHYNEQLRRARCPNTALSLPTLDTFHLGQLFQMFLITHQLEVLGETVPRSC